MTTGLQTVCYTASPQQTLIYGKQRCIKLTPGPNFIVSFLSWSIRKKHLTASHCRFFSRKRIEMTIVLPDSAKRTVALKKPTNARSSLNWGRALKWNGLFDGRRWWWWGGGGAAAEIREIWSKMRLALSQQSIIEKFYHMMSSWVVYLASVRSVTLIFRVIRISALSDFSVEFGLIHQIWGILDLPY